MFACRRDLQFTERNSELFLEQCIKALAVHFPGLALLPGELANTEENRTHDGRSLIFAASNPQDELRYVTMCYRII